MSDAGWYEVTSGPALLQGDVLTSCPVFLIPKGLVWPLSPKTKVPFDVEEVDLIILSQSCDLENEKVEEVLLAQVIAWPNAVRKEVAQGNKYIQSSKFRKSLIEGNVPGLSLLHKHVDEPRLEWSVVNFKRLHTLPKEFIQPRASSMGARLRLRSPYREHLAQAFARYFMRVGLPHNAKDLETEGDIR